VPFEPSASEADGSLVLLGESVPKDFLAKDWEHVDADRSTGPFIDRQFRKCASAPAWSLRFRAPHEPRWTGYWFSADGRTLWIGWEQPHPLSDVACLLSNSPAATLLALQGHLCLHASVVGVAGRAVLFLGREGAGKSTTAAMLYRAGHIAMADDVGVVRLRSSGFTAASGMTALSLTQSTAALFADRPLVPQCSRTGPWEDKRLLPLTEPQPAELPIGAVVVLQPRRHGAADHDIRRLDPLTAQLQIAPHVQARWLGADVQRNSFRLLSELVRTIPVYSAQAADDLTRLPAFIDALAALV